MNVADGPRDSVPRLRLKYTNWTNLDAEFNRPYERGDRLVRGWSGELVVAAGPPLVELAEEVFARHNRDDRPDGQLCPSMSIGDVVVFGEVALSVDRRGFVRVALDAADLITGQCWSQMIAVDRQTDTARSILAEWATPAMPPTPPATPELGLEL